MVKPKLVVLRGKPTSGKSTAWHSLRKKKELKGWAFIDNALIKEMFDNLSDKERKSFGMKVLFSALKAVMSKKKNILIEEMSRSSLNKGVGRALKKYNYEVIVFQFEISRKTAYKRDVRRAKDKWHPFMGKEWINKTHDYHEKEFDKKGILIDCDKLNKKEVVDFILKNLLLK